MWGRKETNPDFVESRKVMLQIMVPIVIPLILFVFWAIRNEPSAKELFLLKVADEQFSGRVNSIYNDVLNHNVKTVILSDKHQFCLWSELVSKVDLGDSLSKSRGALKVNVFKKNGQKFTFDYKQLAKDL